MENERRATLYVLISALLFSIGGLCVKVIPWSGITINGMRSLISVVVLTIYFKVTGKKIVVNKGVLVGACCMAGVTTLFCMANKLTTAANTIILQFTAPIFVIWFSWLFFKERPKKIDMAAWTRAHRNHLFLCGLAGNRKYAGKCAGAVVRCLLCGSVYAKYISKGRSNLIHLFRTGGLCINSGAPHFY